MKYQNFEQIPLILSVEEIADILQIGRNTAYNLIRSNQIESVRIGRQIRVSKSALIRFLDKDSPERELTHHQA